MADLTYSELEDLTYSELEALTYAFTDSGEDTESSWSAEQIAEVMSELDTLTENVSALQTQIASLSNQISDAVETLKAYGDAHWATAVGFATPDDVQVTVSADGIEIPTPAEISAAVWQESSRTLTAAGSSGLATASSLSKLKAVADETNDSVNAMKNDVTQALGLIANWTLSGSTLTAYDGDGAVLGTWTVTKSAEGSIIGVAPQ